MGYMHQPGPDHSLR